MPTNAEIGLTPEAAEEQFLRERARLGAVVLIAGILAALVGEFVFWPGERPWIHVTQLLNIAALAVGLLLTRDQGSREWTCWVAFAGFFATAIAIGAVGVIAGDATSTMVVLVGLTLGAAIVVPWGARYQFAGVIVVTLVTIWALATIRPGSRDFWLQPTGSVLPTYAASILVSYLFRRERVAIFAAQHHRRVREAELQTANRELEEEVHRHEKTEERLRFAMLELDHRVKNTLATLESIAQQTLDTSPTPDDFVVAFRGRLRAVASIHDALAQRKGTDLGVRELLELVVGPYRVADHSISLACDDVLLSASEARTLGTALHELATNASKYGALSTPEGKVEIEARVAGGGEKRIHLNWRELGGPPVGEPDRCGLGTKLIETALAYESGGTVDLRFEDDGVRCEIDIPLGAHSTEPA